MSKLSFYKHLFVIFILALVLILSWFRSGYILGSAEGGLPFNNLQNHANIMKHAWAYPAFGNPTSISIATYPTYFILSLLEKIGIPGFIIESFFFLTVLMVAGVSMYLLTYEFFPKTKEMYIFLAVLLYWFNPFSWVSVWNRALYNFMVFWAYLPLALLLFYKGIKVKDFRYALIIALSSVLFSFGLASVVFNLVLWGLLLYTTLFFLFFDKKDRVFLIKYFLLTFLLFCVFNFWWISQLFSFVASPISNVVFSSFVSSVGNLETFSALSKDLGVLVYLTRFMHRTFFTEAPIFWIRLFNSPLIVLGQFLLTGVVFLTITMRRSLKPVLFFGTIFVISIFLTKGNAEPLGELFNYAFSRVYALQVFRNPFEKIGFLIPLAASPLFAYGLFEINNRVLDIRRQKLVIVISYIFIGGIMAFPFWKGFVFSYWDNEGKIKSYEVKVPDYYRDVDTWFSDKTGDFRFISLPLQDEGITYDWEIPYSGIEPSSTLFKTSNISFNTTIPFFNTFVNALSKYQLDERMLNFFPFSNSKYLVLRKDIDYQARRMANPETVREKLQDLVAKKLINRVYESGKLEVYEVEKNWFWPKFYITGNIYSTNEADLAKIYELEQDFPENNFVTLGIVEGNKLGLESEKTIISPDEVLLQKVDTPTPKDLSEEDILSRLFHVEHLPGQPIYPLVRIKEKLEEVSRSDYYGWLIYRNGILGKRAVEVYKLRNKRANEMLILNTEENYKKEFEKLTREITSMLTQSSPISSLLRDSLLYHWILFDRADSPLSELLEPILSKWGIKPKFELPVSDKDYVIYSFTIPYPGKFSLVLDKLSEDYKFLVDGKLIDQPVLGRQNIDLNEGEHEIAITTDERTILTPILVKETEGISNRDLKNWKIDIPDMPTTFKVEFDYRLTSGEGFETQFTQNIDWKYAPVYSRGVFTYGHGSDWRHWESEFTSTAGADTGLFGFSVTSKKECEKVWLIKERCLNKKIDFQGEIKNLTLSKLSLPGLHLEKENAKFNTSSDSIVIWNKINPTMYNLKVNKKTDKPELLVFSELYNPQWEISFDNHSEIPDEKHILVNDYANGWLIEKPGEYELTLEFTPERLLDKAKNISFWSTFAGVFLLGMITWRRKK
ncbi:hypothetical protein A3D01_04845 [Candidatus Woesebacteria bacterium RIFCSPHIGHO2_02_FULL_39_13]|uniref:Alpha-(1->3)-arabinofuranosyltransferase N-terminal GT-C domain-containing protein n=1 Tax=Candidatus Woesebacteria bacterium RIFCSPHIGHO2_02_FULL_39_13 TaxID=1802505 RepID=A0A1F7Z0A2_9BACT|nr:MAG: hypothetical protein A2692_00165 [Candidatus Woesebacteria bacterium RIFCSPHIGHO2_01_FULL_39_95]OGM32874.1 MAG: hypothetical protein A3D01_04845 [Candidatus Woesebacteria bacterium RIFCSPHIGHO2_02_FULL_39_13]OGM74387.1 MAG: hypothetical protein A3H19_05155 [Candidatus Woesebacteria bacterium RIFCSPLOWO2_12_FULL_39_9]